jgi:hypothetical protein
VQLVWWCAAGGGQPLPDVRLIWTPNFIFIFASYTRAGYTYSFQKARTKRRIGGRACTPWRIYFRFSYFSLHRAKACVGDRTGRANVFG